MTKNIDTRKIKLIEKIASINSIEDIENIDKFLRLLNLDKEHKELFKEMRKGIDVETLKKEQNFKNIDRTKFNKLVEELDIQESLEELLEKLD